MGTFATGVAIITTRDRTDRLYGLTGNSFSSVSLDPPLVLWSSRAPAPSLPAFRAATHFGVNVLGRGAAATSSVRFARPRPTSSPASTYALGEYGVPLIAGAAAHFECRIVDRYYGGDHEIFLGHVERYRYVHKPTLLFCHGAYCEATPLKDSQAEPGD